MHERLRRLLGLAPPQLRAPRIAPDDSRAEAIRAAHALLQEAYASFVALRQYRDPADQERIASSLSHIFDVGVLDGTSPREILYGPQLSRPTTPEFRALWGYAAELGRAVGAGQDPHRLRPPAVGAPRSRR